MSEFFKNPFNKISIPGVDYVAHQKKRAGFERAETAVNFGFVYIVKNAGSDRNAP